MLSKNYFITSKSTLKKSYFVTLQVQEKTTQVKSVIGSNIHDIEM